MNSGDQRASSMDFFPPSDQHLCYVSCNFCNTVLAVGIPCKRLMETVKVKCGYCGNLSYLSTRRPLPPSPPPSQTFQSKTPQANQFQIIFFEKLENLHSNMKLRWINEWKGGLAGVQMKNSLTCSSSSTTIHESLTSNTSTPSFVVKPPEKKHRLPSAYNRFMREEIQRIKTTNPRIPHREAFSAAAKNWARYIPNSSAGSPNQSCIKND